MTTDSKREVLAEEDVTQVATAIVFPSSGRQLHFQLRFWQTVVYAGIPHRLEKLAQGKGANSKA